MPCFASADLSLLLKMPNATRIFIVVPFDCLKKNPSSIEPHFGCFSYVNDADFAINNFGQTRHAQSAYWYSAPDNTMITQGVRVSLSPFQLLSSLSGERFPLSANSISDDN